MRLDFEKFLNDNGLKVGDKIKLTNIGFVYEIAKNIYSNNFYLKGLEKLSARDIQLLQSFDFEKIEPKKKVDNVKCSDYSCDKCPACCITCFPQLEQQMRPRFEEKPDKEAEE